MSRKFKFTSKHKKPKINLLALDEDKATAFSGPHTELFSNKEITIEGCRGVMEYKDTYLKLKINKGMIVLCGENFRISHYEGKIITVKGDISTLEFCL